MPKKTKRQSRREPEAVGTKEFTSSATGSRMSDFNPDYTYILHDLRRIGIIAGSFLVILIALAFIIPLVIH